MLSLLCWAALASAELLKLPFEKVVVKNPLHTRQKGNLELPLSNDLAHQRYLVNLTVGTPPQQFALTADTGSTDFWVPAINNSGCAPSCPPTFDPRDSSTARVLGRSFNASYGLTPDFDVVGDYYNDTVRLGNAEIPNMAADVPKTLYVDGIFGLLGLGSRLGEATYINPSSPYFHNASATFPTIYDHLQVNGYIQRRLFSIWLNEQSATTGNILFGGVDATKYHGELRSVPVVLSGPTQLFTSWAVNLTSVNYVNSSIGGSQSLTGNSSGIIVILDSGSPNMYLPTALANAVADRLGATTYEGFPYVPCSLRQDSEQSLEFNFGDSSTGPSINVPIPEIIYPFGDPANIGNVTTPGGVRLCYLGLNNTGGNTFLLGDTFIRSTYLVYDVDNLQVSMAQAAYGNGLQERLVEL